jgi:hypothetical protein
LADLSPNIAAILRQLEEENVRLRASMSAAAGPVPPSPKAGGPSA